MFCPNCGAPANENQAQCANCGTLLTSQISQSNQSPSTRVPGFGLAIASMVLGIVSLALFCVIYFAIPCAIVGIALAAISLTKAKKANVKSGMAIAGLVCSCVSLGILIIIVIFAVAIAGSIGFSLAGLFS